MNLAFKYFNSLIDLSEETFIKLQNISRFEKIQAHTKIFKVDETPSEVFLLTSGIIRAYIHTECGKEYNKNLFLPINFVGPLTALIKKEPAKITYETLTDCEGYILDYTGFIDLCKTNLDISFLYGKILEKSFIKYEKRNLELLSLDATQRYLKLREQISNIDDLIPQFQIASYLNITPVQLSRIRKKIL